MLGTGSRLLVVAVLLAVASPAAAGVITGKVNAKSAKLRKDAVVYVEKAPGGGAPKPAQMDQKGQTFVPFVLPVVKGSDVEFLNNDNTGHNVFTPDGDKFDLGVFAKGESRKATFAKEGVYTILCKMHPSMLAYVVALDNPYFAVTAEDGSFRIEGVPPGEYTLKVWHERKKAEPAKVKVADAAPATVDFELK